MLAVYTGSDECFSGNRHTQLHQVVQGRDYFLIIFFSSSFFFTFLFFSKQLFLDVCVKGDGGGWG